MRLRQIEYFIAVAEAGSLTKAAKDILVAQPSLSQQIAALESELGAPLFERLPRGLALTGEGRVFLVEARRVVAAVSRAKATVRTSAAGEGGELRLGTVTSLAARLIPETAGRWMDLAPRSSLRLSEYHHSDALTAALESGDIDLAIGPIPARKHAAQESLGWEEFTFVVPRSDPLSARDRLDAADLAERQWVLFDEGHGLTQLIERVCAIAGFAPKIGVRTTQVTTAARLADAGLGPTLLPANVLDPDSAASSHSATRPIIRELCAYARQPFRHLDRSFVEALRLSELAPRPSSDYDNGAGIQRL
ncbi:MAG: LysR family transcriptional regulator [Arthrobacter sp.]|jgi:DNA-binding transcriptional LysR family regulator|nr:LysR family transcriptional regulator [Arthrobacter sp.]